MRQTPLTNSLALGYLLTDDPYADATPLGVGSRELFVPDLAIGRLVEMPAEIKVALDNYVTFDGLLDPQTALSTGYDFLDDGAEEIAKALRDNELGPNGDGLTTAELRGDLWDSAALDEHLTGTATVPAPDIASVNAHFDHFRALPAASDAAGNETDLYTTDDVLDEATRPTLERSLLFSMGCHGGLSVSDLTVGGIRTNDWAQSFAGAGAVFAGNTGFGYGDTAIVAATEDLMLRFAGNLDGTMTVGEAMSLAKQRYISATRVGMTPFDEKVVAQVVMYGMPQYRIGSVTPEEPTFVTPTPDTTGLGLDTFAVTLGDEFELETGENGRGQYWTFGGDSQATAGQPVQPRAVVDVTADAAPGAWRPHHQPDVDRRPAERPGVHHAGSRLGRHLARGEHHAHHLPDPAAIGQPLRDAGRTARRARRDPRPVLGRRRRHGRRTSAAVHIARGLGAVRTDVRSRSR